jgi:hypothetical protein
MTVSFGEQVLLTFESQDESMGFLLADYLVGGAADYAF